MKNTNNKINGKTRKRKSIDLSNNNPKDPSNNNVFINISDFSFNIPRFFPIIDVSNDEIDIFNNKTYDISIIKRNIDQKLDDFDKKIKEIVNELLDDINIKDNDCLEGNMKNKECTSPYEKKTKKNNENTDYFLSLMKILDNDVSNNDNLSLTLTHSYNKNKTNLDKLLDKFDKDYKSFQYSNTLYSDTSSDKNHSQKLLDNSLHMIDTKPHMVLLIIQVLRRITIIHLVQPKADLIQNRIHMDITCIIKEQVDYMEEEDIRLPHQNRPLKLKKER